jgi:hypothetical protein
MEVNSYWAGVIAWWYSVYLSMNKALSLILNTTRQKQYPEITNNKCLYQEHHGIDFWSQPLVAHACNPSYLGQWDSRGQHGPKSLREPILTNSCARWVMPLSQPPEAEIRRTKVPEQPGQKEKKIPKTPSKWKKAEYGGTCLSSKYSEKHEIGDWSGQPRQKARCYLQNNQSKKSWGCGSNVKTTSEASLKPWVQTPAPPKKEKMCEESPSITSINTSSSNVLFIL